MLSSSPARAAVQSVKRPKCGVNGSSVGVARSARCGGASLTVVGRSPRRRTAHSSASTLVGSLTTSVPRAVATTLSWLIPPSTLLVPSGQTGESSSCSKPGGRGATEPLEARLQGGDLSGDDRVEGCGL